MLLSDNETKIDLLNNEAIAKTVVSLIKESKKQPISIGIHGDWGAGKSSVLEMIEDQLKDDEKFSCIRFNGWRHQGLDDAKIALMGAVVSELEDKRKLSEKAKEIIKKIWKNINWFGVAKQVGKIGISLATGTTPIALLDTAYSVITGKLTNEKDVSAAIESIDSFLKEAKITVDNTSNTEFREFQKNFNDLLDEAKIEKLVVLIDDLDRCLPEVTIETLEAMRLFMFAQKTAFVIAADELMIQYAVKKHFPDVFDGNMDNIANSFSQKYLEKLIQVPFRIPALGEKEAELFITLLMVESCYSESDERFEKIRKEAINRLRIPWDFKPLSHEDIKKIIGENEYRKALEKITVALQIGPVLAKNARGNPRNIKRFLNMLFLRSQVAINRGFGEESFKMGVLAKLMLAEYFLNSLYKDIALHLDVTGQCLELSLLEGQSIIPDESESQSKLEWTSKPEYKAWISLEPKMGNEDLRPYFFACKEKQDLLTEDITDSVVYNCVKIIMLGDFAARSKKEELNKLTDTQAFDVVDIIIQKLSYTANFMEMPDAIGGLRVLMTEKTVVRCKVVDFITGIEPLKVGVWILSGWEESIPNSCVESEKLKEYYERLEKEGSELVKKAASMINKKGKR